LPLYEPFQLPELEFPFLLPFLSELDLMGADTRINRDVVERSRAAKMGAYLAKAFTEGSRADIGLAHELIVDPETTAAIKSLENLISNVTKAKADDHHEQ
jgi:hypothetical protein